MSLIDPSQMIAYLKATTLGKPYELGAAGPDKFDCSGEVCWGYKHFGVTIPHHAETQSHLGVAVALGAVEIGDLVFSNWDVDTVRFGVTPASHVGIATSSSEIIVAPHTGTVVQIEHLSTWDQRITGIRRYDMAVPSAPGPKTTSVPIRKYGSPLTWDMTVSGIAQHFGYGSDWQTIWNSQANAALRTLRKDPAHVQPGDHLVVTLKL